MTADRLLFLFCLFLPACFVSAAGSGVIWDREAVTTSVPTGTATVEAAFIGRNDSVEPLHIRRIRTSCACTTAVADRQEVPPGERFTVSAKMGLIQAGTQRKAVYVETNLGMYTLSLTASQPGRVVVGPEQLEWRGFDSREQTVDVRLVDSGSEELTAVAATVPGFIVQVKIVTVGRLYQLLVRPDSGTPMSSAVMVIRTQPDFATPDGHRVFLWRLPAVKTDGTNQEPTEETK